MKFRNRVISIIVSVSIILVSVIGISAAPTEEQRYGKGVLCKMQNSAALTYVYDLLVEGCADADKTIFVESPSHIISWDEMIVIYKLFHSDYPEYFWLTGAISGKISGSNGTVISVEPKYSMTGSTLTTAKSTFQSKVNSLISGLDSKTDYEKSKILHDRLAETVTYLSSSNDQNAYGALVGGKAVCAGYARAYQHLMNKVGIPAWYVTGTSINPVTNLPEGHAWNLVLLDNQWYFTDVTWDDQGDTIFYEYLNTTTENIQQSHSFGDFAEYLPKATATNANYFFKNGLIYSSVDVDAFARMFKESKKIRVYVKGNTVSFEKELSDKMFQIIKKMGVSAGFGYSYSTIFLDHEYIISLNIIDPNHKHSVSLVPQKAPTCTAWGNKAYYECDCGKWFADSNATIEIIDRSSVTVSAIAHSPSGWQSDSVNHWKVCVSCNAEIANSQSTHIDADKNSACDLCGSKVIEGSGLTIDIVNKPNNNTSQIAIDNSSASNVNTLPQTQENDSLKNNNKNNGESEIIDDSININSSQNQNDNEQEIADTDTKKPLAKNFINKKNIILSVAAMLIIVLIVCVLSGCKSKKT